MPRSATASADELWAMPSGSTSALLFSGGGKDSLLSAKLLKHARLPFASFAYTKSSYGPAALQAQLLDNLLDRCPPRRRHLLTSEDDFAGDDALFSEPFEAETPWSVFAALPIALACGYGQLVIGNERSADRGNVWWDQTGEEINHQWGKSYEAERLLADYVASYLVPGCRYWSVLKPVRDTVIFNMLGRYGLKVAASHSCNRAKPWCRRCPKCEYVLLGVTAYLGREVAAAFAADDALAAPENFLAYRQMVGLERHSPFECVGELDEVRLMFHLLFQRGGQESLAAELEEVSVAARPTRHHRPTAPRRGQPARHPDAVRRPHPGRSAHGARDARRNVKAKLWPLP